MRINRWIICTVQVADGGEDVKLDAANESLRVVKKVSVDVFSLNCKVNFTPKSEVAQKSEFP